MTRLAVGIFIPELVGALAGTGGADFTVQARAAYIHQLFPSLAWPADEFVGHNSFKINNHV